MLPNFFFLNCDQVIELGLELMYLVHLLRVVLLQFFILLFLELFQTFEFGIELVMPGVEHHGLEHEGAGTHDETCYWQVA